MSKQGIKQPNLPPKNVAPADLFAEFMKQPRPYRKIESPLLLHGTPIPMAVVALTTQENQIINVSAERWVKKILKDQNHDIPKENEKSPGYDDLYDSRAMVEMIYAACRKPEDVSQHFFPSPDVVSSSLSVDQTAVLFKECLHVKRQLGVIVSEMEQYEMDEWIKVIQKGGLAHFLSSATLGAQIQLWTYMANQLLSLQTSNSLSTSQLNNGSSDSKMMPESQKKIETDQKVEQFVDVESQK